MASEPYAYFNGDFVPLSEAKVSIMTNASTTARPLRRYTGQLNAKESSYTYSG